MTGTFLLAYIVIVILIGIPLTFLEIILGQFCQQGTTKLWRAVPVFKGKNYTNSARRKKKNKNKKYL